MRDQNDLNTPKNSLSEFLYEELITFTLNPEVADTEEKKIEFRQAMNICLEQLNQEIILGAHLLYEKATPYEKDILDRVIDSAEKSEITDQQLEDGRVLLKIAARELVQRNLTDCKAMIHCIISLIPFLGSAWAALAVCVQELGLIDKAELIFLFSLDLFPNNYLLHLRAADFYLSHNKREKAVPILEKIREQLSFERDLDCINFVSHEMKLLKVG